MAPIFFMDTGCRQNLYVYSLLKLYVKNARFAKKLTSDLYIFGNELADLANSSSEGCKGGDDAKLTGLIMKQLALPLSYVTMP